MPCAEEEILQHCRQHRARYKVPQLVEFVESLPTTSTGKILRRALKAKSSQSAGMPLQSSNTNCNADALPSTGR
jgi:acyl-CoA synthetase (AMP-forming)/AMP-acid ligase II